MFNTEIEKIYDAKTVEELKAWAPIMEEENRHVILAEPSRLVKDMVFPRLVGIENWRPSDEEILYEMCSRITEDRPFIEDDTEWMLSADYTNLQNYKGGKELWVAS